MSNNLPVTVEQYTDLDAIEQMPTMSAAAHDAASLDDRAIANWQPLPGSADADLGDELGLMTSRSRDLHRNNGVAAGGKQTLKDNIIGATLRLSAKPDYRLLGKDIEWAREWSKNTEAQFRSWAETTECDAGQSLNLLGLTLQVFDGSLMNGDGLSLPIWKPRPGSRWNTRLHNIESDRLATPPGMDRKKGLSGGIQHDKHGAPVEYWIMKDHPGDKWGLMAYPSPDQWSRIPAFTNWGRRRVIHLHDKERAGQSRAKPLVAAVMREFKMAGKYTSTELQTAIANGMIAGVLKSDLDGESMNNVFGSDTKNNYDKAIGGFHGQMRSGSMMKLPIGTDFELLNSSRDTGGFDNFMMTVLRYIATGLNIPYELLMKDFSKTNYSSARAALLEAWRYFHGRRRWIADYFLNEVYALWLEEAVATGRVDAPDYYENKYAYTKCRWIMSGRGWVDPVKEANASKIRMDIGLSTLESECAEQGSDWEEVLEQRAHERQTMKDLGLPMPEDVPYMNNDVSRETEEEQNSADEKESAREDEING